MRAWLWRHSLPGKGFQKYFGHSGTTHFTLCTAVMCRCKERRNCVFSTNFTVKWGFRWNYSIWLIHLVENWTLELPWVIWNLGKGFLFDSITREPFSLIVKQKSKNKDSFMTHSWLIRNDSYRMTYIVTKNV